MEYLQSGRLPKFGGERIVTEALRYEIVDELLYQKMTGDKLNHQKAMFKLVIPKVLRATVIRDCHSSSLAGHLGVKKTYKRLLKTYYWSGMYMNIRE